MARLMLSAGMFTARAFSIAMRSFKLASGSAPPAPAALLISRATLGETAPPLDEERRPRPPPHRRSGRPRGCRQDDARRASPLRRRGHPPDGARGRRDGEPRLRARGAEAQALPFAGRGYARAP